MLSHAPSSILHLETSSHPVRNPVALENIEGKRLVSLGLSYRKRIVLPAAVAMCPIVSSVQVGCAVDSALPRENTSGVYSLMILVYLVSFCEAL